AAAAGVDGALLSPGSVDPHSPKVVRAAMGAHFRLPIHPLPWPEICQQTASLRVYLADTNAPLAYTDADFRTPLALIVGGEAEGVTSEAWKLSPAGVRIPMPGDTESLNAAVAAAVLMFEAIRQRQYTYTDRTPYRQSPQP
ncbi:MAG: TrmH family RNA methyltransferase, partial [Anaerolineales bacterium]